MQNYMEVRCIPRAHNTHPHLDKPQFRATPSLTINIKYLSLPARNLYPHTAGPQTFSPIILLQMKVSHVPQSGSSLFWAPECLLT